MREWRAAKRDGHVANPKQESYIPSIGVAEVQLGLGAKKSKLEEGEPHVLSAAGHSKSKSHNAREGGWTGNPALDEYRFTLFLYFVFRLRWSIALNCTGNPAGRGKRL